jgi:hypothetical protein
MYIPTSRRYFTLDSGANFLKSYRLIPCRDSIPRPIAPVSSVAGGDDITRQSTPPGHHVLLFVNGHCAPIYVGIMFVGLYVFSEFQVAECQVSKRHTYSQTTYCRMHNLSNLQLTKTYNLENRHFVERINCLNDISPNFKMSPFHQAVLFSKNHPVRDC